jgi:hypothetical protein
MKKSIKIVSLFLAMIIALTSVSIPASAKAADVIEGFHGGSGTKDDPYQIATADEFEILRGHLIKDDGYDHTAFFETYFELTDDIVYDAAKPLSTPALGLTKCRIDGKGHTVSGITSSGNPLFALVNETEFTDIVFKNCDLKNTPLIAKDVFDCKLSNITFSDSKVSFNYKNKTDYTDGSNFGGIKHYGALVNWVYDSIAENITVDIQMAYKGKGTFGMLFGNFRGNAENITTSGKLKADLSYDKNDPNVDLVGGMFGNIEGSVRDSVNNADITVSFPNKKVGGFIGGISGGGSYPLDGPKTGWRYYNCKNKGDITVTNKRKNEERSYIEVAGISAGYTEGDIENCSNSGSISSSFSTGTAGIANTLDGTIKNCKNTGKISGADTKNVAGIINVALKNVSGCKNSGKINNSKSMIHYDGETEAAGILNSTELEHGNVTVSNCKNTGKITASNKTTQKNDAAGIINFLAQTDKYYTTVKKCQNSGTITAEGWSVGIADLSGNWEVKGIKNVIKSCTNTGTINIKKDRNGDKMAGILGYSMNTTIKDCKNKGKIIIK